VCGGRTAKAIGQLQRADFRFPDVVAGVAGSGGCRVSVIHPGRGRSGLRLGLRPIGWCGIRGDLSNYLPARACAVLTGLVARRPAEAWQAWRRDAAKHPSPNAGPVEAAFAAALGLTVGGANSYGDELEDRGTLGDGPRPRTADISRVTRLSRRVGLAAAALAVVLSLRQSRAAEGERWI
jgi:CobD/Cbib protein